jgi:hypothetical protein
MISNSLNTKFVDLMSFDCDHTNVVNKSIDSYERIFDFSINSNFKYVVNKPIPKLNLPQIKSSLNIDLNEGFEEALKGNKILPNPSFYKDKKWNYLLKSLYENKFISKDKPNFVSLDRIIADALITPYNNWQKQIFAIIFKGMSDLKKNLINLFLKLNIQSKELSIYTTESH